MSAGARANLPAGYVRLDGPRGVRITTLADFASPIAALLQDGVTLYEAAARSGHGPVFHGRAPAYGLRLQIGDAGRVERLVVRHNLHGGAFARITGDRFFGPGRTELELGASLRLRDAGIPTPRIAATVTYPAGLGCTRADVATELVAASQDLGAYLVDADLARRQRALAATGALLDLLAAAGARHHDLNAKNVLIQAPEAGPWKAHALDVDRVEFLSPRDGAVMDRNVDRLLRSIEKHRRLHGALVTDGELVALRDRRTGASRR